MVPDMCTLGNHGFTIKHMLIVAQFGTLTPECDACVALAVAKLCRTFRDQVLAIGAPRIGINPLLAALRKLQPTREHLTPVHAEFFQL